MRTSSRFAGEARFPIRYRRLDRQQAIDKRAALVDDVQADIPLEVALGCSRVILQRRRCRSGAPGTYGNYSIHAHRHTLHPTIMVREHILSHPEIGRDKVGSRGLRNHLNELRKRGERNEREIASETMWRWLSP